MQTSSRTQSIIIVLVLLASASLSAPDLPKRWIGYHDYDGAFFHDIVNNYQRYGLIETRTAQVLGVGKPDIQLHKRIIYGHFPQLLPLLLYGATELFGNNEFALRLVMWFTTLILGSLIYAFMKYVFDWMVGIWALIFFAFSPMVVFLARLPEYEPLVTALLMVVLLAYAYGLRHPDAKRWQYIGLTAAATAAWVGWAGYLFCGVILLHALIWGKRKQRLFALSLCGITLLMGLLFLLHLNSVKPDGVQALYERFKYRSSNINGDPNSTETFTIVQFGLQLGQRVATGYTPTVIVLALLTLGALIRKPKRWRHLPTGELMLPTTILATGLGYVLLLREAAWLHDYLLYYFGVGLALCAALAVRPLWERWRAPLARVLYVVIVAGFFVGAARWIEAYRTYDTVPLRYTLGMDIRSLQKPYATYATNLPFTIEGSINLYAETHQGMNFDILPKDFLAGKYEVYVYCDGSHNTPRWAHDFRVTRSQDKFCLILEAECTAQNSETCTNTQISQLEGSATP